MTSDESTDDASAQSARKVRAALNRLAKWRGHLAGWQLGTRQLGDPESDAVRDHREATLLMRAELTALVGLLVRKGVISLEDLQDSLTYEADLLCLALETRWPGAQATDAGMQYDFARIQAAGWMAGWRP